MPCVQDLWENKNAVIRKTLCPYCCCITPFYDAEDVYICYRCGYIIDKNTFVEVEP